MNEAVGSVGNGLLSIQNVYKDHKDDLMKGIGLVAGSSAKPLLSAIQFEAKSRGLVSTGGDIGENWAEKGVVDILKGFKSGLIDRMGLSEEDVRRGAARSKTWSSEEIRDKYGDSAEARAISEMIELSKAFADAGVGGTTAKEKQRLMSALDSATAMSSAKDPAIRNLYAMLVAQGKVLKGMELGRISRMDTTHMFKEVLDTAIVSQSQVLASTKKEQ
jgi:hypothetical protein